MKKRVCSIVTTIAMIFALFAYVTQPANAEVTGTWISVADTEWYNSTDTAFTIDSAEELAGLAKIVNSGNNFKGKKVTLGGNINLEGKNWTPIGTGTAFIGEFDGADYTISNLYIDGSVITASKLGLFGQVGSGGSSGRHGGYLHDFTVYNTTFVNVKKSAGVVAGSAFHDNVLRDITVDTAVLTGTTPSSAVVGGVQSSQFENIKAKNITINANNGGEIGGMFCSIQGQLGNSKTGHYVNSAWMKGSVVEGSNAVVVSYFKECSGEDITINVQNANSYVGGFASYCLDSLGGDSAFFEDCTIEGLEINILSVKSSPYVGGFIGLRSGVNNYSFTNTDGEKVTVGGFDGCSVQGEINGLSGTYGGFAGQSAVYSGVSAAPVTYGNVSADLAIATAENATIGGFIGDVNTSTKVNGGASYPLSQSFDDCQALGTMQKGDGEPTGTGLFGTIKTTNNSGINIDDCYMSGVEDLDELWKKAFAEDPTLDEATWKSQKMMELLTGNASTSNFKLAISSTITFDTGGGSEIAPISQEFGTAVTKPEAPTRAGYTFAGWDKEIPETMPVANMTITALWTPNEVPAAVNADNGAIDTGDNSNIGIYMGIMLVSLLGIATILASNRRRVN